MGICTPGIFHVACKVAIVNIDSWNDVPTYCITTSFQNGYFFVKKMTSYITLILEHVLPCHLGIMHTFSILTDQIQDTEWLW